MLNRNTLEPYSADSRMKKWFALIIVALLLVMTALLLITVRGAKVNTDTTADLTKAEKSSFLVSEREAEWLGSVQESYGSKDALPDELTPSFDYNNVVTIDKAALKDN